MPLSSATKSPDQLRLGTKRRIVYCLAANHELGEYAGFFGFFRNSLDRLADEDNDTLGGFVRVMHAFLSNLMAAALLAHALLGCCWHHAHKCVQCDETTQSVSHSAACCKHDHGPSQQKQQQPTPCKCKLECAGVCTYLPTQKTQLEQPQSAALFDFAAIVPVLAGVGTPSEFTWQRTLDSAGADLPLRLHLMHQILLI